MAAGCVVEYLQNNQPVIAWVEEIQNQKARLLNINKREMKLPAARLLPWVGPCVSPSASREEILSSLAAHNSTREQLRFELDIMDIWSMAQGEISRAEITWFADLIWTDWNHDHLAALGRAMLQARTHFKFSPPDFEVFSEEVVNERLEQMRLNEEKKRLITQGNQFFRALWSAQGNPAGSMPDDEDICARLKQILLKKIKDPEAQDDVSWSELSSGLPNDPQLPFMLARLWGIVPWHYNFLLDQSDYSCGDEWTRDFEKPIHSLLDSFSGFDPDIEDEDLLSVDSESTSDIDDAFSLVRTAAGFRLRIALACPSFLWPFGSKLDEAVMYRATSLYLPEGTCHMMPEELSTNVFSLRAGKKRPALLLDFVFSPQNELLDMHPCFSWVKVRENITYKEAEKRIDNDEDIKAAYVLAHALRQNRIQQGAVIIEQPDPELKLIDTDDGVRVELEPCIVHPRAQVMISEFMILANSMLASWGKEHDVPLIYRSQDIALPEGSAGEWTDPVDVFQLVRNMAKTVAETDPKPHRGLGVAAYAPITSPLRRYVDLINTEQLFSSLENCEPRWTKQALKSKLALLNSRTSAVGKVQRFRPRYWKLLYFLQNKNDFFPGVVVDNAGNMVTLALPREKIMVRGPENLFGGKVRPGQRFLIRFGKINPLHNDLKVSEAWEE